VLRNILRAIYLTGSAQIGEIEIAIENSLRANKKGSTFLGGAKFSKKEEEECC
tara:strand:+ start:331 stop:489 length:159 start_codon:yes stop_codon:yes gene_type:complete